MTSDRKTISIVLSLYNEAEGVMPFWAVLSQVLEQEKRCDFELLWVNDGSTDNTQALIDEIREGGSSDNVRHVTLEFSRNFGHEAAMIAGIDHATGDAIICSDSDGQHPPQVIPEIIDSFNEGFDIVLLERLHRDDNSAAKRFFSKAFYKVINRLSTFRFQENSTDFFLVSRRVATILKGHFREQNRFIRGFVQSVGFPVKVLTFSAPARAHGTSSYSYWDLVKLAFNALFSFSNKPLRLGILVSVFFVLITLVFSGYTLFVYLYGAEPPSGYTSIILFLSFSFSLLFIIITILALYFEKVIQEIRQRPLYILKDKKS